MDPANLGYHDAMIFPPELDAVAARQPYPLIFATVSGAHLYGFPSLDSDYDLRGVHCLPIAELVGLDTGPETLTVTSLEKGLEMDLVAHEAKKLFSLLLNRNGYVLEQLHSPLVVRSSPWLEELRDISKGCVTRHHAHHYLGFAATQWELFRKEPMTAAGEDQRSAYVRSSSRITSSVSACRARSRKRSARASIMASTPSAFSLASSFLAARLSSPAKSCLASASDHSPWKSRIKSRRRHSMRRCIRRG